MTKSTRNKVLGTNQFVLLLLTAVLGIASLLFASCANSVSGGGDDYSETASTTVSGGDGIGIALAFNTGSAGGSRSIDRTQLNGTLTATLTTTSGYSDTKTMTVTNGKGSTTFNAVPIGDTATITATFTDTDGTVWQGTGSSVVAATGTRITVELSVAGTYSLPANLTVSADKTSLTDNTQSVTFSITNMTNAPSAGVTYKWYVADASGNFSSEVSGTGTSFTCTAAALGGVPDVSGTDSSRDGKVKAVVTFTRNGETTSTSTEGEGTVILSAFAVHSVKFFDKPEASTPESTVQYGTALAITSISGVTLPTPSLPSDYTTGATFGGWYTSYNATGGASGTAVTSENISTYEGQDLSLYAKWEYTATLYTNPLDLSATTTQKYVKETGCVLTAPTKPTGFGTAATFDAWYDTAITAVTFTYGIGENWQAPAGATSFTSTSPVKQGTGGNFDAYAWWQVTRNKRWINLTSVSGLMEFTFYIGVEFTGTNLFSTTETAPEPLTTAYGAVTFEGWYSSFSKTAGSATTEQAVTASNFTNPVTSIPATQTDTFNIYARFSYTAPDCAVGDIVYADGTTSSPSAINAGKTVIGVVFDAENKRCMGLQQSASELQWCVNSATYYNTALPENSTTDGSVNQAAVVAASDYSAAKYPAFGYAKSYSAGGFTDWYIPSIGELMAIFNNRAVLNTSLSAAGGTQLRIGASAWQVIYASSSVTPSDCTDAKKIDFRDANTQDCDGLKTNSAWYRVVRKF